MFAPALLTCAAELVVAAELRAAVELTVVARLELPRLTWLELAALDCPAILD
jgi:hypothetical protein